MEQGDRYDIGGRNVDGDWLEFCCVNGQRGWIYAQLLIVSQETTSIPLAQNIPAAPYTHQHARVVSQHAYPGPATTASARRQCA